MAENEQTEAADELTQAATEAVESQESEVSEETNEEVAQEQVAETPEEETVEELDKEGLPSDHKERSDLGRKLSATHRRIDEIDGKFGRIEGMLETLVKPQTEDPIADLAPDEPITRAEAEQIYAKREEAREIKKKTYDSDYSKTLAGLGPDLGEDEWNGVLEELKTMTYDPTSDPIRDARENFFKAENIYLRKKVAQPIEKKVPLKNDAAPGGGITNQKAVVKETAAPKLDAAGQSYLDYVTREDGAEHASKLVKDIG